MDEVWKRIEWADGNYYVSNLGNVKSEDFVVLCKDGRTFPRKGQVLQGTDNGSGYRKVAIPINGKATRKYVHRLVAEAFVENPDPSTKTCVNHKDFNPRNNNADNLEWVTYAENNNYSRRAGRCETDIWRKRQREGSRKRGRAVVGTNIRDGSVIVYEVMSDCVNDGFSPSSIYCCCRGKYKQHNGFVWRYRDAVDSD